MVFSAWVEPGFGQPIAVKIAWKPASLKWTVFAALDAVDASSTGTIVPSMWVPLGDPMIRRSQGMQTTTTVGLHFAKSVFRFMASMWMAISLFAVSSSGAILSFFQKSPSCLVGIEACASSHFGRVNFKRLAILRLPRTRTAMLPSTNHWARSTVEPPTPTLVAVS